MNIQEKIKGKSPAEWAFDWNQARLIIAGATLLLAKQSPILLYLSIPIITPIAMSAIGLAWVISGIAAGYLGYMWLQNDKQLFGGEDKKDMAAFGIAIISGLHLGIAGLTSMNIGFMVIPNFLLIPVMIVAGLAYFWSAYHLHSRGGIKAMFPAKIEPTESTPTEQV